MANNRMFMKCRTCGESLFMAKYYPSTGWYNGGDLREGLADFLEKHSDCIPDDRLMWGDNITLAYEIDTDEAPEEASIEPRPHAEEHNTDKLNIT